jgi:hypothetical protein
VITITSDGGRIGELWWFNSRTTPTRFTLAPDLEALWAIRWGTFGVGRDVTISLETCELEGHQ